MSMSISFLNQDDNGALSLRYSHCARPTRTCLGPKRHEQRGWAKTVDLQPLGGCQHSLPRRAMHLRHRPVQHWGDRLGEWRKTHSAWFISDIKILSHHTVSICLYVCLCIRTISWCPLETILHECWKMATISKHYPFAGEPMRWRVRYNSTGVPQHLGGQAES